MIEPDDYGDLPEGYEPSIIDDSIIDDDYFASLENTLENAPDYEPSLTSVAQDADEARGFLTAAERDALTKPVTRPKSGQKLTALETVVDELTEGGPKTTRAMPQYEKRIKSVIEQGIDLIGEISKDVTKTRTGITEGAGALAGEAKSTLLSSGTTQNIIKSMGKAMEVVKGTSTAKKVGYTLGGLGAIGALSGRSRENRRR